MELKFEDAEKMAIAWADSRPVIADRWPTSKGGSDAVIELPKEAFEAMFQREGFKAWGDEKGFLSARVLEDGITEIILAVEHIKNDPNAKEKTSTRLRRLMLDSLTEMAHSVKPDTPIHAEYPDVQGDDIVTTVIGFLDEMEKNNGVEHVIENGMRTWPKLTAGKVLEGLKGIVP